MIIQKVHLYKYKLELLSPLYVKGEDLYEREGALVHIISGDKEGFGEIAPLPSLNEESLDDALLQAEGIAKLLTHEELPNDIYKLDGRFKALYGDIDIFPSVQFGIETAILNTIANHLQKPLHKLLSKNIHEDIHISALLTCEKSLLAEQISALLEDGYTSFKLKVGKNLDEDIEKVKIFNDVAFGKALLHADANQNFNLEQAKTFIENIGIASITYMEEPFSDLSGIHEFVDETTIPIALDESISKLPIEEIKSMDAVDFIVLKPTLLGGIEKIFSIVQEGTRVALKPIISSSYESDFGILTLAQLAGALGHRDTPAGLDTLKYLKTHLLKNPKLINHATIDIRNSLITSEDINFDCLTKIS